VQHELASSASRAALSRRRFLTAALSSTGMLLLVACGQASTTTPAAQAPGAGASQTAAAPGAAFDWKKYQGTQIRLLANAHPWTDTIKPQLGDFEAQTGIHVVEEDLPETQFRQKLTTELSQATGSVDVMMSAPNQEGLKYSRAGWYEPLSAFINNPSLTSPEYAFSDFAPATINIETVEGKLIGIPIQLESEILFYRSDLFQQHNLTPPTSFDDLVAVAKALHNPDAGVYAIGLRGNGAAATSQFSTFLYGYGGDWTDQSGAPTLDNQPAIDAFTYYGNLARLYGPPNSVQNSWPENVALFQQGKLAMFADASVFKVNVEDTTKSQVVGKIGYALMPKGPVTQDPASYVWGLSIPASSQHKEAAWYLIQWATSRAVNLQLLQKGVPVARQAPWTDPAYTSTSNKEFDATQQQSVALSKHSYNPNVVPVQEFRDAVGPVIVTAIQGGDVRSAAETAQAAAKDVLARAG
jgi:multiple sugar transport system substrate-binding protein